MSSTYAAGLAPASTTTHAIPATRAVKSDKESVAEICEMLTYCRPAGSKTERSFIARFIVPTGAEPDKFGNYILRIGTAPILWSSHTDTVHRFEGKQTVAIDDAGYIVLAKGEKANCLGADCTSGVWLMLEMIRTEVEGLYIFHRAEESGGIGSGSIADQTPELLDGIQCAIAFDRYGTQSIITHQAGGECCSQAFADSLADKLPGRYKADPGGTFTDTASYTKLIPECTNISVGYYNQHCKSEDQEINHLLNLRDAMVEFTYEGLEIQRDPSLMDDWSRFEDKWGWADTIKERKVSTSATFECLDDRDKADLLVEFVREYPEEVADLLREEGFDLPALLTRFQLYTQA